MIEEQDKAFEKLRHRFPRLRPIKSPPTLITMNGCGISLFGRRDFDAETGTYLKTRFICFLFIPLIALDTHCVADAGGRSWYFFGKQGLSSATRAWNLFMTCLLLTGALALGWKTHTDSPEYRAAREIQRAAEVLKSGDPVKAAGIYKDQIGGPQNGAARDGLRQALESSLQSDQPRKIAATFRLIANLPAGAHHPAPILSNAVPRGLEFVARFRPHHPEGALEILDQVTLLKPEPATIKPLRIDLLKNIIAATPDNTNRVVELALIYEADQQPAESVKLLLPYRQKLGTTEGARILGQHLLREGEYDDAYGLLFPYVQSRLEKLHRIESSYTNILADVYKRAIDDLREGRADHTFYGNYELASKEAKDEMVDKYVQDFMRRDPAYQRAVKELKEANEIVGVALDLGIVQLNRAQNLKSASARKTELEAAEKTFLAIRGFAGDTDEYQMFLGQVYYWLGKSNQGKELFDQLLARHQRAYPILLSLGRTLRSVGDDTGARALIEEAYQTGKAGDEKFSAARTRALLFKDPDDQIAWLEKADVQEVGVQIELNSARGKKALHQGNKKQAAAYLQKAISGYETQTRNATTLNNSGLACFDLYEATGNIADHQRGMKLLEEAIALDPGDSILLINTVHCLITRAVMDVVGDAIHTEALGERGNIGLLAYLYRNDRERSLIYQKLRENESMKKALAYLDKALLLAPKNHGLCSLALSLQSAFRDLAELQKLQQRFLTTAPDLVEAREDAMSFYRGENTRQRLEQTQADIKMREDQLALPDVKNHPPTFAYVAVSLVREYQTAWAFGGVVDMDRMLQLAHEAHKQHPTSASQHALKFTHIFRASQEFARQNSSYLALQNRRAVAPDDLLALILERGGTSLDVLKHNEDFVRALALEKESSQNHPGWATADQWALLRNSDAALAQEIALELKDNQVLRLMDELQFQLNPLNSGTVLEQFWRQKLAGDNRRAAEIYQEAIRQGVPLPPL